MAIIPLKQAVIISPYIGADPDWNEPKYGEPYPLDCRFQETMKLVRNARGEEVTSVGTFIFDKLSIVSINDRLTFTNENNVELTYTPIAISVRRALNGKPLLTEVEV
ncbi:hypothetical protein [Paenibacillus terrigena]|uniref:hypothetical protein n=1 Tax=Paenibacillus terrigena TaxID=369333 RepID=UPI0028D482B4|nr:hypothetical protein [Paenibacillus terrigena]